MKTLTQTFGDNMSNENYINHVVMVLDASWSMDGRQRELIKVADGQIEYLARRSKELDQETRVSVYDFADNVNCLIYDKDVLRLPSISTLYKLHGNTALLDATDKAISDLSQTATLYGDHAFLVWVLTDGQENRSRFTTASKLAAKLGSLPDNWTVGVLVPDQRSVFEVKSFGFSKDNIAVWDAVNPAGIVEVGETIRKATDNFMVGRSKGVRGTRSIFSTGADTVNAKTVHQNLVPYPSHKYMILPVSPYVNGGLQIRDHVEQAGHKYNLGQVYYQLTKTETIQPTKNVLVLEKSTGKVYAGPNARKLVGLPDSEIRVKPQDNPLYDIFVQSTAVNRKVLPGTSVIILK
jgi:hypothetical protein